jgi:hypothetical protein
MRDFSESEKNHTFQGVVFIRKKSPRDAEAFG